MAKRDATIIGDFLRYFVRLFAVFFTFGLVLCFIKGFSLMALLINPLIYSVGIGLIIIVLTHDINSVLGLVGLGEEPQLSPHIKYHNEVQEIGMLMGMGNFDAAMKKVDILLHLAPQFARAHILRGEILLTGFEKKRQARESFDRAMALSQPEDEEHQLAVALKASTFG